MYVQRTWIYHKNPLQNIQYNYYINKYIICVYCICRKYYIIYNQYYFVYVFLFIQYVYIYNRFLPY